MAKYCRYMCLAMESKNEMGTRHMIEVSMLNRILPNDLVNDSRNGIIAFPWPAGSPLPSPLVITDKVGMMWVVLPTRSFLW